mmetsp:Transcript_23585/g.54380  ORF Transcript_23585/g.54380 Transcript_23585/m.54380 type:complete len:208 (-) Transcript_23585:91-714(-)
MDRTRSGRGRSRRTSTTGPPSPRGGRRSRTRSDSTTPRAPCRLSATRTTCRAPTSLSTSTPSTSRKTKSSVASRGRPTWRRPSQRRRRPGCKISPTRVRSTILRPSTTRASRTTTPSTARALRAAAPVTSTSGTWSMRTTDRSSRARVARSCRVPRRARRAAPTCIITMIRTRSSRLRSTRASLRSRASVLRMAHLQLQTTASSRKY